MLFTPFLVVVYIGFFLVAATVLKNPSSDHDHEKAANGIAE